MLRRTNPVLILIVLVVVALLVFVWALTTGTIAVSATDLWSALFGDVGNTRASVIRELRLPRAAAVFACGGLLALAGGLMQVLLRNPLADPYILGVSGGAAVGALSAMLLGLSAGWVDGAAFAGALVAMLLVFGLAHGEGAWTQTRLLLTGVIVAAGCGAVVTLMLSMAPDGRLQSMLFWLMGDASGARRPWPALGVLVLGVVCVMPFARDLNVLARGDHAARTLGVNVVRLRPLCYALASLLTAVSVTLIGPVGFVGLVVPHLVRFVTGNDQRLLLPFSVLVGGILLTLADTGSRTLIAPTQLPVGVLTALIGVPVFLFLLTRKPG